MTPAATRNRIKSNYLMLSNDLIKALGPVESIFLSYLVDKEQFYENLSELEEDGFFYRKQSAIERDIGLSPKVQRRILEKLLAQGVIETTLRDNPAKLYYRINHEKLEDVFRCAQREHQDVPDGNIKMCRKGTSRCAQREHHIRSYRSDPKDECSSDLCESGYKQVNNVLDIDTDTPAQADNNETVNLLTKQGIWPGTAADLVHNHGEEKCRQAVEWLPDWIRDYEYQYNTKVTSKGAFLKRAIEQNWGEPESHGSRVEMEKIQARRMAEEKQREEEARREVEACGKRYESLTPSERAALWQWIIKRDKIQGKALGKKPQIWQELNDMQKSIIFTYIDLYARTCAQHAHERPP